MKSSLLRFFTKVRNLVQKIHAVHKDGEQANLCWIRKGGPLLLQEDIIFISSIQGFLIDGHKLCLPNQQLNLNKLPT